MSGRDAKLEGQPSPPEQKPEEPRREEARSEGHGVALMGRLAPPAAGGGPGGPAAGQAAALSRANALRPGLAGPWMLQLQRQLGNRHVQRVVSLAREEAGEVGKRIDPDVEQAIQGARGGGRALDGEVRGRMETAFGTDFSGVRVHTGATADQLNRQLAARAFTTGDDIFFRAGEYRPGSSGGRELLAHELTHVVQQQGAVQTSGLTLGPPGDRFEQEADATARAVMQQEVMQQEGETEVAVRRAAIQPAARRSVQRADDDLVPLPLRILAGTFDQAADTFSFQLKERLKQEPNPPSNVAILIVNGANLRVYDIEGKPASAETFRLKKGPTDLPVGVFTRRSGDPRLRAVFQNPDGSWFQSPRTVVAKVNFTTDVEQQEELNELLSQFQTGYYVNPSVDTALIPEEELPKAPPPEDKPEFMKFVADEKAELPAWPAAVIPLTPQVTSVGSVGKFYCRVDKYNPWLGIAANTFAMLEPVNFRWEVLRLNAKLLTTGRETASRWQGATAGFAVRERHISDDEQVLMGENPSSQSVPEKAVRRMMKAQMAIQRRLLAYTGEAALTLLNTLAGGTNMPTLEDFIDFPFDEPGDYFIRCLATPVRGEKSTRMRATSVAGAMVSVFDIKELAAESIDSPEALKLRALAGLEKGVAELEELRKKRAAAETDAQPMLDIDIKRVELKQAYLAAAGKVASDEYALHRAELDFVRSQLAYLTGKEVPKPKRWVDQEKIRLWTEGLRKNEKDLAAELERADTKLGEGFKRTGLIKAALVDDTTGSRQPLTFSIGEKSYVAADKLEVVIADITAEKGRVFNGTGTGSQGEGRSDAWHEAMRDLRRNLGRGRGWLAWQAPAPYAALNEGLENPMQLQLSELDQLREHLDDVANALTLGALLAAPFTGGASLGILAVLAPIGIGSSLYNIVNRALYGDLELDEEAVLNFIDVATLGLSKVSAAGKLGGRGLRIVATASKIAIQLLDAGTYVVLSYMTYQDLMADRPGETEGEARVRKLRALLSFFQTAAIPVATHLWPQPVPKQKKPGEVDAADAEGGGKKPEVTVVEEGPGAGHPKAGAAPHVPASLLAEIPKDVLKNAPPVINPHLKEGTVRIVYTVNEHRVITEMRMEIGEGTRPDLVAAHVPTARDMARYMGLSGRARLIYEQVVAWITKNPAAEPNSRAWEAEREVSKLQRIIEERAAEYNNTKDPALREELRKDLDHLEAQLLEHARDVDLFDVEGRGFVAAEGRGAGGEATFGPQTTKREAFRKLGGFETKTGSGGTLEAASDFRGFVDAVVREGLLGASEDMVQHLPDPKGASQRSVLDQVKKTYVDKLVERATDPVRLRDLDSYRDARKGTTKPSEALHAASAAEAKRIAALLPEGDRAAFLAAWKEKMPAPAAAAPPAAAPVTPAAAAPPPAAPPAAQVPAAQKPAPAEGAAAAPTVPDSTRAAQKWLDDLSGSLSEGAQKKLADMTRNKTPEEARKLVERLGGKEFLETGAREAAAKAAAKAASPERAQAAKAALAADPSFLGHPDVKQAIEAGDAHKLRSEMAAEMAARQLLEGPYKGMERVKAYRGVRIIREQPHKTVADARVALDAKSKADTGEPYKGVIFERGGKVYTVSTDIDVLIVQEPVREPGQPPQPAKILHFEEVKSGENDKPGKAKAQVEKADQRLRELAQGDTSIHLELADETEITGSIDAASGAKAEQKTRGPLGAKDFNAHLDASSEDLLKAAQELLAEQRQKKLTGGGTPPGTGGAAPAAAAPPASPAPASPAPPSPAPGAAPPAAGSAPSQGALDAFHLKPGELQALLEPPGERIDRPQASEMMFMTHYSPDRLQELLGAESAFRAPQESPGAEAAPAAPAPVLTRAEPAYKTLDDLLTPDRGGFADKDLQEAYARYVDERTKAGDKPAGPEEWVSLTRGRARELLRTMLGPGHFFGFGTGVERLVPLTDFQQPVSYMQERVDADIAEVTKEPGKLWERLGRLQTEGVTGGAVGASLFNILKGNIGEILSAKIQQSTLAKVRRQHADAVLYNDVRARLPKPDGTLTESLLFTDNVIASKRGNDLQLHAVFEVKAGSHGGQEATTQIFEWIEGNLTAGLEIQVGGEWFRYDPDAAPGTPGKRVIGLARAERHLIAVKGAEHLGGESEFKTVREATRHALPQTAEEINFLARALIERTIPQHPQPAAPAP